MTCHWRGFRNLSIATTSLHDAAHCRLSDQRVGSVSGGSSQIFVARGRAARTTRQRSCSALRASETPRCRETLVVNIFLIEPMGIARAGEVVHQRFQGFGPRVAVSIFTVVGRFFAAACDVFLSVGAHGGRAAACVTCSIAYRTRWHHLGHDA